MKNVPKPLTKSVLIPLGFQQMHLFIKKMFGSGAVALIISNEEMNDIMKIVKSHKESGLLMKAVSETM